MVRKLIFAGYLLIASVLTQVWAGENRTNSYHAGVMHPAGVDIAGYSSETRLGENLYRFYTIGIPAFAAIGFNYYDRYRANGLSATVGTGIGSVLYASIAYQWRLGSDDYLKVGAGLTAGVAYSGVIPVLGFEHRF